MNFLSHYHLDRHQQNNPYLLAGVCTPDLVSIFDRQLRIKHIPLHVQHDPDALAFFAGIQRHYQTDKIFHSCPFFVQETDFIADFLTREFNDTEVKRRFFVAHILLELMIDKVLIDKDFTLINDFYLTFSGIGAARLTTITQEFVEKKLEGYEAFMERFIRHHYLFHYPEEGYVPYVLNRIIGRVGIRETAFLERQVFKEFLTDYQVQLTPKVARLFSDLHEALGPDA